MCVYSSSADASLLSGRRTPLAIAPTLPWVSVSRVKMRSASP